MKLLYELHRFFCTQDLGRLCLPVLNFEGNICLHCAQLPLRDLMEAWIFFEKYRLQSKRLEDTHVANVHIYQATAKWQIIFTWTKGNADYNWSSAFI